jgi:hypothetical protein
MRGNQRPGELLERLVLLRDCYQLRSAYDRDPVLRVEAAITYGESLLRDARLEHESPPFGWFHRAA